MVSFPYHSDTIPTSHIEGLVWMCAVLSWHIPAFVLFNLLPMAMPLPLELWAGENLSGNTIFFVIYKYMPTLRDCPQIEVCI